MDLDNIQRKYGLPAPLPVVQNGKFAPRFPLNLEHRGDDVFQFGGKYIGEIENIYDLLYKILTNQEIDASLALPYAIKITEDKLYIRDKTNSEWILIFDITKPNFPKEIELYELIYKAITHQVIGEDTSYPGQFKIEENILYVRDKDNLTWTQIGDVTKEFLGATEATQAILEQINEILIEVQELKTELNRQIATTNETLTTALQAANEAMTSAQSINIRTFNSVEEMKASNTLKSGALAKTLGFYTAGDGGGADYVIVNSIEGEADEASIITLQNGLYAKLLIEDYVNVKWLGARGNGSDDDSDFLQKAVNLNKKVHIPDGYYALYKNINFPDIGAGGKATIEGNGQMRTHLICKFDNENDCLIGVKTQQTFSWGITINHLHINGENHKIDGLYLKGLSYALGNDVNIESFNGSGFILDKIYDSEFRNFKVMLCGRSTGDITNNAETEKAPVEIINTFGSSHSNYIKFVNCQFEQQNCSPHVHIKDQGVIAISFIKSHVEATDRQQDFVYCEAGDLKFIDCDLDGSIRYGLTTDGYGNYKVEGGRSFKGIKLNRSGTTCAFLVTNAEMDTFDVVAPGGSTLISNSKIENLKWSYPVSGPSFISNCVLNNVTINNRGGNDYDIFIDNCKVGTIETDVNSGGVHLFNCDVGTVNMKGGGHSFINSKYDTLSYYDMYNSTFMPRIHEIRDDSAPQYGTWKVGDIVHNTNPTAGSYIGWVCITAGSPGTWKGFGLIQS